MKKPTLILALMLFPMLSQAEAPLCSSIFSDIASSAKTQKALQKLGAGLRTETLSFQPLWFQSVDLLSLDQSKPASPYASNMNHFDLTTSEGRQNYFKQIDTLIATGEAQADEKDVPVTGTPKIKKGVLKGLKRIRKASIAMQDPSLTSRDRESLWAEILELSEAVNNEYRYPMDAQIPLSQAGFQLRNNFDVKAGRTPGELATNIKSPALKGDVSLADPPNSSFWQAPENLSQKDLSIGFGRSKIPNYQKADFTYKEAKDGYGVHAGFKVKRNDKVYKIEFGDETKVKPFNARIFDALGFFVPADDYISYVSVAYDRKILTEFNSRQDTGFDVTVFGKKITRVSIQKTYDPFDFINQVVLKDGRIVSASWAKDRLMNSNSIDANTVFDENFESQIQSLVFQQAAIEVRDEDQTIVGRWDFNSFDHPDRRELRGLGMLSAWLGSFDMRKDNNRIVIADKDGGGSELHFMMTDVGCGLGTSQPKPGFKNDDVRSFAKTFLKRTDTASGPEIETTTFGNVVSNLPFEKMNWDDARWMARRISQLTAQQLKAALQASGMTDQEQNDFFEILKARRAEMLNLLELPDPWNAN